jgi:hypothetical protein
LNAFCAAGTATRRDDDLLGANGKRRAVLLVEAFGADDAAALQGQSLDAGVEA